MGKTKKAKKKSSRVKKKPVMIPGPEYLRLKMAIAKLVKKVDEQESELYLKKGWNADAEDLGKASKGGKKRVRKRKKSRRKKRRKSRRKR